MKSLRLGYVPTQLSDRSYLSGSRYGGSTSGLGSSSNLYKSYDYPSSSLSGSAGNYRSPVGGPGDRALSYASNSGAVSSIKGKFDRSLPSSSRDTTPGYPSSSLDRYTGRSTGGSSDYTSKLGSGYSSDADIGGSYGSSSYGGGAGRNYTSSSPYSSSARATSPAPSYSTRASSKPDYSRTTSRDYGSSYTSPTASSAASSAERAKSSSYSLTPFKSTAARSTDLNLTPFNLRNRGDSSVTAAAAALPPRPSTDSVSSRKSSSTSTLTAETRPSRLTHVEGLDSSDSEHEPPPGAPRQPDVRYLTSRATSPMEFDREDFDTSKLNKNRNRLIARTKTKTYPVLARKRLRNLKDTQLQVDCDELDKFAGRIREKEKPPESKFVRSGPSVSSDTKAGSTSSSLNRGSISETKNPEPVRQPVVLPKQSGFVPKDRKSTAQLDVLPDDDSRRIKRIQAPKGKDTSKIADDAVVVKQSSYLERKFQQQEENKKIKKQEDQSKLALQKANDAKNAQADNLTLADSRNKVMSWKKEMQKHAPDSPDEDENSIFGKDDWKKKTKPKNVRQQHPSHRDKASPPKQKGTTVLSPTVLSPSDSDRSSDTGFNRPFSPNTKTTLAPAAKNKVSTSDNKKKDGKDDSDDIYKIESKILDARYKLSRQKSNNLEHFPSPPRGSTKNDRKRYGDNNNAKPSVDRSSSFPNGNANDLSTESLAGDISSGAVSSNDENGREVNGGALNRATSMASLATDAYPRRSLLLQSRAATSMTNLASSVTSLPDLVTSSEAGIDKKRTGYIGTLRDIDSWLGFDETDDEFSETRRDGGSSEEIRSSGDDDAMNQRNKNDRGFDSNNEGSSDGRGGSRRSRSRDRRVAPSDDVIFIGDTEDIDEILGNDLVTSYLGVTLSAPEPKKVLTVVTAPLRLNIGHPSPIKRQQSSPADASSTDSLLDTPVPDTPDVPLSPRPAFFPSSGGKDRRTSSDQQSRDINTE